MCECVCVWVKTGSRLDKDTRLIGFCGSIIQLTKHREQDLLPHVNAPNTQHRDSRVYGDSCASPIAKTFEDRGSPTKHSSGEFGLSRTTWNYSAAFLGQQHRYFIPLTWSLSHSHFIWFLSLTSSCFSLSFSPHTHTTGAKTTFCSLGKLHSHSVGCV